LSAFRVYQLGTCENHLVVTLLFVVLAAGVVSVVRAFERGDIELGSAAVLTCELIQGFLIGFSFSDVA
jgi:hypothetical protein